MEIPDSMKPELAAWNNGLGIDLESWVACEGRFALAVGYASIFWPEFVEFEGYVLRKGFSEPAKEIYEAKLRWQFPERQVVVEFHVPEDDEKLAKYQSAFWQK